MKEELQSYILNQIEKIKERKELDDSVVMFQDLGSKYAILKPSVIVEVALPDGLVIKIDVSRYFKNVL